MSGPLRPEDVKLTYHKGDEVRNGMLEFCRASDGKLLCTVPCGDDPYSPEAADYIVAAWNCALSEGMELGRRMLQDEIKDVLGIPLL